MNDLQPIIVGREHYGSTSFPETAPQDLLTVLIRRKWLVLLVFVVTLALTAGVTTLMRTLWRAEVELVLLQRQPGAKVTEDPAYTSPLPETPATQVEMLQSSAMVQRLQEWYANQSLQTGQPIPEDVKNAERLQKDITVVNGGGSNVIYVSVDAPGHDLSVNIANGLAQAFVDWKKELAQADVRDTETQLETELVGAKAGMLAAIDAEYAYRNEHHIVNVNTQENDNLSLLQQDEANVSQVQQDLDSQQAQLAALDQQLASANHSFEAGNGVRDETFVQLLQTQLAQAEIARATEAQKVTPYYPGQLGVIDQQVADLKARLNSAIRATINNAMPSLDQQEALVVAYKQQQVVVAFDQAKLEAANGLRDQLQQQLNAMPTYDTALSQLDLDVQTATARYNTVENALNTTRLEINTTTGNVEIADSAVTTTDPYRPNWTLNLSVGALVGLFLAGLIALLVENSDRRVQDVSQIERFRLAPIIGVLPPLDRSSLTAAVEGISTAALSEHFSIIRTNLLTIFGKSTHGNGKIVLVTSAAQKEGKSLVLSELARTLADAGKRVIVVDGNLRHPSLLHYFPTTQDQGLSNVLLEDADFDVVANKVNSLLSVLQSGPVPDEPTRLLSTDPFLNLLYSLRSRADFVLVDSSACDTADPLLVAPHVDYVIQVVGANKSSEKAVHGTLAALAAISHVGVIVNFANVKQAAPHQLISGTINAVSSGNGKRSSLGNQIRLASADSTGTSKSSRGASEGDIIQVPTNAGDV